ncbi:cytochrome c oxidase assembly protein [Chromatiales bacterium (ex Bugula neritina AB1)]|nr:cytochrome c oxidase assembly protein [Chromatiales bacterium (ex Bugula neritina AB1)]
MVSQGLIKKAHLFIVGKLCLLGIGMFGFGYLMVPLYDVICDITGLNGKTSSTAMQAPSADQRVDRKVTVEFVSVVNSNAAWSFKPTQASMEVTPGQSYNASYEVVNLNGRPAVGQAVPSVAPSSAAKYFNKIECFCFTSQEFDTGGRKEMPLVFFIDEDLPRSIDTVTLSYTYFDTGESVSAMSDS